MKTIHLRNVSDIANDSLKNVSNSTLSSEYESASVSAESFVYNEMSDFPVRSRSEIERLKENAIVLRDLGERLTFMSNEIKYLLNLK